MKMSILIIKEEDLLDDLLKKLAEHKFEDITIINTNSCETEKGIRKSQSNLFSSIRYMMEFYNDESRTLLIPVKKERVELLKTTVKDLIPEHKFAFCTLNIGDVEGYIK